MRPTKVSGDLHGEDVLQPRFGPGRISKSRPGSGEKVGEFMKLTTGIMPGIRWALPGAESRHDSPEDEELVAGGREQEKTACQQRGVAGISGPGETIARSHSQAGDGLEPACGKACASSGEGSR